MKALLILILVSIGLVCLWEPIYQKITSELDKINQGRGTKTPSISAVVSRILVALLLFYFAYLLSTIQLSGIQTVMTIVVLTLCICVVLSAILLMLVYNESFIKQKS